MDHLTEFYECIKDLLESPSIRSMNDIPHHADVSCLDHSIYVSYISFLLCRFFGLDYACAARGALLHDLYLYDWHKKSSRKWAHLFSHPKAALKNASRLFDLTDKEKDIILKHMWPLTFKLPKFKESFLVSCADKFCALMEILFLYKRLNISTKLESLG